MKQVVVTGSFDDIRSRHVRFLEEAAKLGLLHVVLWSDKTVLSHTGASPTFTEAERFYFVQAIRYVDQVSILRGAIDPDQIPVVGAALPQVWAVTEEQDKPPKRALSANAGIEYHVVEEAQLMRFPPLPVIKHNNDRHNKKVVVTGCFDWLHSGHVRFFEETSELGDLYVILGHDQNILLLKGEGHPLFPENERRYMVQAIRFVKQTLVSTGSGWMDAEPEIALLQPDMYAVNEDGDKGKKQAFCENHGIEYVVLQRLPKEGLPKRESTALRGF